LVRATVLRDEQREAGFDARGGRCAGATDGHPVKGRRESRAKIVGRYDPTAEVKKFRRGDGEEEFISLAMRKGSRLYIPMPSSPEQLATQRAEPVRISPSRWLYRDYLVEMEDSDIYRQDDAALLVKRAVLREERELAHARQEVETLERFGDLPSVSRDVISDEVRMFVWQRDGGRCVRCGAREKLEFDHIIPLADGGSSTERNIQLLCEPCNRSKGRSV